MPESLTTLSMPKIFTVLSAVSLTIAGAVVGYVLGQAQTSPTTDDLTSNMSSDSAVHDMSDMEHVDGMSMDEMMGTMNAELMNKDGDEFDKAFLENMIIHHEGAVSMAQMALEHAGHEDLKVLSRAIIDAQEREIEEMQLWLKAWYGVSP